MTDDKGDGKDIKVVLLGESSKFKKQWTFDFFKKYYWYINFIYFVHHLIVYLIISFIKSNYFLLIY